MSLQTQQIPMEKLVVHESAATVERTQRVPPASQAPILVKPLPGTDLFHVRDGANRTYNARQAGQLTITAVVGTPDYSVRRQKIADLRIRQSPTARPVDALQLVPGDDERQDLFYRDCDAFGPRTALTSIRGTVVHVLLTVQFGEETQVHYMYPRKTVTGGIILNPTSALPFFRPGTLDQSRLNAVWGDPAQYDPAVLPAWLELSDDGQDCFAGGFYLRRYYQVAPGPYPPPASVPGRGVVQSAEVVVIYPDAEVYRGSIPVGGGTVMVLWTDTLVNMLADQATIDSYNATSWWRRPTSLVFSGTTFGQCFQIEHSCGCTCGNCD